MTEELVYKYLLVAWLVTAGAVFILLLFIKAPYGRHFSNRWGISINTRLGWLLMEAVSVLVFAACFFTGTNSGIVFNIFFIMWQAHYIHRAFIYPLSLKNNGLRMPLAVTGMGIVFNTVNSYLNGRYLFTFSTGYDADWLNEPRFIIGLGLFIAGFAINRLADSALAKLRSGGKTGYHIPEGGLFLLVSCPNYLGEIIIWAGWAVATWSLPGLAFAVWTFANLAPRATAHHRWYRTTFPDYPPERRALIPYIW